MTDSSASFDGSLADLLAHSRWVERLAVRLAGDGGGGDDLAQEAWLAALQRERSFDADRGGAPAWFAGVLRRMAAKRRRTEARLRAREATAAREERIPSTEELVAQAELRRRLGASVEALDEPYRTTVLLRWFQGLTPTEIAKHQGVPAGTVRARLSRALDKLRDDLDDSYAGSRGAWSVVALGLVPVEASTALLPSAVPSLSGLLAMKALTLGLGASAVALVALGIWYTTRDDAPPEDPPVAMAPQGDDEPVGDAGEELEVVDAGAGREAQPGEDPVEVGPEAEPEDEVVAAPVLATRFLAEVVDPDGRGIANATIETSIGDPAWSTSLIGMLDEEVGLSGAPRRVHLAIRHPEWSSVFVSPFVRPGKLVHLGRIQLEPAGRIRGTVTGTDGLPIGNARVVATDVDLATGDLEEMRRKGPPLGEFAVDAYSDASGRFEVAGIASGFTFLWAGKEEHTWSWIGPIEVFANEVSDGHVLELEAISPTASIRGIVLSPEGEPVPNAILQYKYQFAGGSRSAGMATDEDGTFVLLLDHEVEHDLRFSDRDDAWADVQLLAVQPGDHEVVAQFREPHWIEVRARSLDGEVVERFRVDAEPVDAGSQGVSFGALESVDAGRHEGGLADLRAPTVAFTATIDAPGYALATLGPFEADAPPALLEFELEPLPVLRGRVLAQARPLGGAEVSMHEVCEPTDVIVKNGYRTTVVPWDSGTVLTNARGEFELHLREAGTYEFHAEFEGLALGILGPFEFAAGEGGDGFDIRMGEGGAIEGRVLLPPGQDPSGVIVGVNDGKGHPRTTRVGPDGSYRFELLAPGMYEITRRDVELAPQESSVSRMSTTEPVPISWNCAVLPGETTWYDLDLRDDSPCIVHGVLDLVGSNPEGWSAILTADSASASSASASTVLGADGRFDLEVPEPGRYALRLRAPKNPGGSLLVSEALTLERGESVWDLTLPVGRLRVSGPTPETASESTQTYSWDGSPPGRSVSATIRIELDESGRAVLRNVPAGPGAIRGYREPTEAEPFGLWHDLVTVDVPAGGTATTSF